MHKTRESIDAQQAASKNKIKHYRLGISYHFPMTHPAKGAITCFDIKIENAIFSEPVNVRYPNTNMCETGKKLHTIRANYEFWQKRMIEVQAGRAVIELFYWRKRPYHSKQVVFATLDESSGCGVQKLLFHGASINEPYFQDSIGQLMYPNLSLDLAKNDGLTEEDFKDWFKGYDLTEPMAIIHFTSFRY